MSLFKSFVIPSLIYKWFYSDEKDKTKTDQQHVMSQDELLDQTSEDSFPASDPPGHFSKSIEDHEAHS